MKSAEKPAPSSDLRIAISGKSGCGNSTVSRLVAEKLGLRVINYTFKNLARDSGMSFEELALKAETDPQYDLTIDRMQVDLARMGGCVLGSRLAIWLLRDTALTVYLMASLDVRAARIARREGGTWQQSWAARRPGTGGTATGTSASTGTISTRSISPRSSWTLTP